MKVAIDIGHSPYDKGAESADKCINEYDYGALICPLIRAALGALYEVRIFNRGKGSIGSEVKAINTWGADVIVSIHCNCADSRLAQGHEVLHYPSSKNGKLLAAKINSMLACLNYTRDRGTKEPYNGRGLSFLRDTKAPAVIVELAFLSNKADVYALQTKTPELAQAVAVGIKNYFYSIQ